MAISMTDVAFEGFRLIAKKPVAVLGWAAAYLIYGVVGGAITVQLMGPQLMELQRIAREVEGSQDPASAQQVLTAFMNLGPAYVVVLVVGLLFMGVLMAAVNRAVLRPEEAAPLNLSFGMAEIIQVFVGIVWYILFVLWMIGVGLLVALVGALGGMLAAATSPYLGILVGLICVAIACAGMCIFLVKFSLGGAASFAEGGFRLFRSWGLTKGHFWPLLGAYFVMGLVTFAIVLGVVLVAFVTTAGASGFSPEALRDWAMTDTSSLAAYFSPMRIMLLVGAALLSAFGYAMFLGSSARAYEQVSRG